MCRSTWHWWNWWHASQHLYDMLSICSLMIRNSRLKCLNDFLYTMSQYRSGRTHWDTAIEYRTLKHKCFTLFGVRNRSLRNKFNFLKSVLRLPNGSAQWPLTTQLSINSKQRRRTSPTSRRVWGVQWRIFPNFHTRYMFLYEVFFSSPDCNA